MCSVRSHSHESAAAQQVGAQEEAGHQSSEGHRSTAHTQTHHQLPMLPVSERASRRAAGLAARRRLRRNWELVESATRTQRPRCFCRREDGSNGQTRFSHKHSQSSHQTLHKAALSPQEESFRSLKRLK